MATNYRELVVWQKAMELAEAVYRFAHALPDIERFGLSAQLRRAAISVPSNVAEGHERRSRADYRRFITIACGSLAELETQVELAIRLHHPNADLTASVIDLADQTGRLLRAIERKLRTTTLAEESARYETAVEFRAGQPSALSPE
jgi:four helix bundle protein